MTSIKFLQLFYKTKFDIVITDIWSFFFPLLIPQGVKLPKFIMDLRTYVFNVNTNTNKPRDILEQLWTKLALKFNQRKHNGITFISDELRDSLQRKFNLKFNKNCHIWPSGVNTTFFNPRKYRKNENEKFIIFFHGEMTSNRGLVESILAMQILKEKNIPAVLHLVGDGDIVQNLKDYVCKQHFYDYVKFFGRCSYQRIPELIATADVCLMAYPALNYWEVNVPLKLLEYMAMEKVIILTTLRVFERITKKKKCAIFIPNNKPETIADAIIYAYQNRRKLSEWGKEGRKIVAEAFSWDRIAHNFSIFLENL
ncbi:MAG: glycosyltransferase family 4 protein [candidate division WOR-3 bacterium]|nr:glycosyltransferase family 4 protein [candidate division WOR-3 bacterium]